MFNSVSENILLVRSLARTHMQQHTLDAKKRNNKITQQKYYHVFKYTRIFCLFSLSHSLMVFANIFFPQFCSFALKLCLVCRSTHSQSQFFFFARYYLFLSLGSHCLFCKIKQKYIDIDTKYRHNFAQLPDARHEKTETFSLKNTVK